MDSPGGITGLCSTDRPLHKAERQAHTNRFRKPAYTEGVFENQLLTWVPVARGNTKYKEQEGMGCFQKMKAATFRVQLCRILSRKVKQCGHRLMDGETRF